MAAIPMPNSAEFDTARAEAVLGRIEAFRKQIGDRRRRQSEINRRQKLIGEWTAAVESIANQIGARAALDAAPGAQGHLSLWNERAGIALRAASVRVGKTDLLENHRNDAAKTATDIETLTIRLDRLRD